MVRWTDGWMDERIDEQIDGWMEIGERLGAWMMDE